MAPETETENRSSTTVHPAPERIMTYKLRVVPPDRDPYDADFDDDTVLIGRSPEADLTIDDQAVSRRHARLRVTDSEVYLEDLSSHNGTWLGKVRVTAPALVMPGLTIRLAAGQARKGNAYEIRILELPGFAGQDDSIHESGMHKDALELLEGASDLPGMALDEKELRAYVERFHLLNGVHAALGHQMSESALLDVILDRIFEHLRPDAGLIYLKDQDDALMLSASRAIDGYEHQPLHSQTLIHELMDKGKALLFNDIVGEAMFEDSQSLHGAHVRSLLAAPLMDREGKLGMMVLYSRANLLHFREQDLELLVQLAAIATLRIRNLRLTDLAAQQLMELNRFLNREVEKRTRELEMLDRIVATINREHELDKVLTAILEHGMVLFPEAQRGSVLLWDPREPGFRFRAVSGLDEGLLQDICLDREDAVARYITTGKKIP